MLRIHLSDDCYLFSSELGHNSGKLIITAHGVRVPSFPTFRGNLGYFKVPAGMRLHFYVCDGSRLMSTGIADHIDNLRRYNVVEVIEEGNICRDYLLEKFKSDSYDVIEQRKTENEMKWSNWTDQRQQPFAPSDVLTIRNRWRYLNSWNGIRLSVVLSLLNQYGYHYRNVYCGFCRSPVLGYAPREFMTLRTE